MTHTDTDPLFTAVDGERFTKRQIGRLAAGVAAAVRVRRLLTPDDCTAVMRAMACLPTADYDPERVPTPIVRFGPALNDYRRGDGMLDADRYWEAVDGARAAWRRAGMLPDPVAVSLARIGEAWGSAVLPATIDGRPVFGGTMREINDGALVHWDDVTREFPQGVFDQDIVAQLAFNAWIAAPEEGGATTVWRHRWEPVDERHRDAYGYHSATVAKCQSVTISPHVGDGLLFNPANFHAVRPNPGERRIAVAFFLGLTTTGNLITWS